MQISLKISRDIEKCILVSRFSAASTSLCRFSPISALISRRQGIVAGLDEEQNNNIIDASTNLFLEYASTHTCTLEGKDVLIPILISNTDLHSHQSSDYEMNKLGWRQALLVNNEILLDDILDSRCPETFSFFLYYYHLLYLSILSFGMSLT